MLWIKDLWENKRWLFWLLLPVVLFVAITQLMLKLNISGAKKDMQKAKEEDNKLKEKIINNEKEQIKTRTEIDMVNKTINKRNPEDIPEDWYKDFEE